jgi:uncharacterized protein
MVRSRANYYLRRLLALDDTPERIALAFAVGVFLAFSPLLGLHTVLGVAVSLLFGLNRVAVLLGVFVNNPWTLVPIYAAATYVGGAVVGYPEAPSLPHFGWRQLSSAAYWVQLMRQWRVLVPTVLGSSILAVLLALLSYPIALYLIRYGKGWLARKPAA